MSLQPVASNRTFSCCTARQILAEVGFYFLGAQTPVAARRAAAKQLFNALDNDGSLRAWEYTHNCQNTRAWDGPMPPFGVGADGC